MMTFPVARVGVRGAAGVTDAVHPHPRQDAFVERWPVRWPPRRAGCREQVGTPAEVGADLREGRPVLRYACEVCGRCEHRRGGVRKTIGDLLQVRAAFLDGGLSR